MVTAKTKSNMKKIYSFALAAVALFSAASCQEELANVAPQTEGGDFTVTAVASADTKTILDGVNTNWTPGDKIVIYNTEGKEVTFATDITEAAATAEFTNEADFVAPSSLVAVYPKRTDRGATTFVDGVINGLHIGGTVSAIANTFDPKFGVAVGTPVEEGSNELVFNNVHALVKFTVGGTTAPTSVVLKNNGEAMIAGMFNYNVTEKTFSYSGGANSITVSGTFEVGKTYYVPAIPAECVGGISLCFDGVVVKNTGVTATLEPNKIYNLGTVALPEPEPEPEQPETPFTLERVAARYSNGANAWCSFIPGISNRTMAADGKYVYLQSSVATPTIYAVEIASLLAGDETPVYKQLSTTNMSGGTHGVSTLRCIANENGDPVLIATNLAVDGSQNFNIYAYPDGTDADPVLFHAYRWDTVAGVSDWRRYGDRISVSGTWQNGKIWAPSQSGTKVMGFGIANGATDASMREYCWFDTFGGALAEVTLYPGTTEALLTSASSAGYWTPNTAGEKHSGGFWPKWDAGNAAPELNGAFSFQFFTVADVDYIAYVQLKDNTHAYLVVVEDKGSLAESLASNKLFNLPLHEGDAASCAAGNTYGDCAVVTVNDKLHIVAMMQGGGLSIFEVK